MGLVPDFTRETGRFSANGPCLYHEAMCIIDNLDVCFGRVA